jgi:hypothetical protein
MSKEKGFLRTEKAETKRLKRSKEELRPMMPAAVVCRGCEDTTARHHPKKHDT